MKKYARWWAVKVDDTQEVIHIWETNLPPETDPEDPKLCIVKTPNGYGKFSGDYIFANKKYALELADSIKHTSAKNYKIQTHSRPPILEKASRSGMGFQTLLFRLFLNASDDDFKKLESVFPIEARVARHWIETGEVM